MLIYKATNKITGKSYVGQTIRTMDYRKWGHQAAVNKGSTTHFHNSIRKNGMESFEWEVICECNTKEELDERERHYIKLYGDYNLTEGGEGTQLFGEANGMYGKKRPELSGENNPACRPEVRQKISDANKGRPRPDVSDRNKRLTGKSYEEIYGEERAKEIRQEMSESRRGRKDSDETRRKKSEALKGKNTKYIYEMIAPDGEIFITNSMYSFAKEHGLNKGSLLSLVNGKNKKGIHKGWRGRILDETTR